MTSRDYVASCLHAEIKQCECRDLNAMTTATFGCWAEIKTMTIAYINIEEQIFTYIYNVFIKSFFLSGGRVIFFIQPPSWLSSSKSSLL